MTWLGRLAQKAGRRAGEGGTARPRGRTGDEPRHPDDDEVTILDLTDAAAQAAAAEAEARAAELNERLRNRRARLEAEAELARLRHRHWSGERVLEEGRAELEWWQHPDADPYAVLGLLPGAPLDAAAAARRRIAQECHPDRTGVTDPAEAAAAMQRMVAANAAYERLRRALRPV